MAKQLTRSLASFIIPFIGSLLIKFIYYTSKKTFHPPRNIPDSNCVIGFWHGNLLLSPLNYRHWKKEPKAVVMISEHFDGELIAKTMKYFGLDTIRGSSRSGAAKVLMKAIKKGREGWDIGITPDGPRGPRFTVSDGIVVIAQKLDCPVILQNTVPSKYWQLKSWDGFIIPKPFGHLHFYASEPFMVTDMGIEEAKKLIHDKLMQKCII